MVTLGTEYKVKVGSLAKKINYRRNVVSFGDGYEQRAISGINHIRESWEITFTSLSTTAKNSLEVLLNNAAGVDSIEWISPDQSALKKWIASNVSVLYYNGVDWEISCTLTELTQY
jgi:phage-related protein